VIPLTTVEETPEQLEGDVMEVIKLKLNSYVKVLITFFLIGESLRGD
jgi:hypothetical protein